MKHSQVFENQLQRNVMDIEKSVNQISNRVLDNVSRSVNGCSGDQILVDCFNCMKLIEYNANLMNNKFTDCFNNATNPKDVKKCLRRMQNEVHLLKSKLSHGDACQHVSKCVHKVGTINKNTIYCLSHQGKGVTHKCMSKVKGGDIQGMTHGEIDNLIN
jgi:hypothetical protein